MSDVLVLYRELRAGGAGHHAALRQIARRLGVDERTAGRIIDRAESAERRSR